MKCFSGIGSRETPPDVLEKMKTIGKYLASRGYTLRSGGADGADKAFEDGCDLVQGKKEIYLPWKGFNNSNSELYNISENALYLASRFHPSWDRLSQAAKKLMARNCYQVLGYDLDTPCDFICCWTVDGKIKGGTGQALRIAKSLQIPVFNLYHGTEALKNYLMCEELF